MEHLAECESKQKVELHRLDPERSRPALGTWEVNRAGDREWKPQTNEEGSQKFGVKKYTEKVIVFYCPECGVKQEEAWTE